MVYLLRALDFRRFVREALADCECEVEFAAFVHALVWLDREGEVERVVWIGEVCFHCTWES